VLYLDSSALVKRYVSESGTPDVGRAIAADPDVTTVLVTQVEVRAALAAARRAGRFAMAGDAQRASTAFAHDWRSIIAITLDGDLCESAAALAERHALRAYGAVQLAAALFAASVMPTGESLRFGTFDADLRRAARAEDLALAF